MYPKIQKLPGVLPCPENRAKLIKIIYKYPLIYRKKFTKMFDLNNLVDFNEINNLMNPGVLNDAGQIGGNIQYNLIKQTTKRNEKFKIRQTTYNYKIDNNIEQHSLFETGENFKKFIYDFCAAHIDPLPSDCKIKFLICHNSFDVPLNSYFISKSQFSASIIHTLFQDTVQSRKAKNLLELTDADEMDIIVTVAETVSGAGRRPKPPLEEICNTNFVSYKKVKSLREFCRSTPCILSCEEDNFCLVRSILLGRLLHVDKDEFKKRSQFRDPSFTTQVRNYANKMNLPDSEIGLGLEYIPGLEKNLNYQVVVYRDAEKVPLYWDKEMDLPKIYLHYNSHEHHFSLIKSIRAFFGHKYFCDKCMKIYSTVNAHRCSATCETCFRLNCENHGDFDPCICGAKFKNDKCQFYHAQVCKIARKCSTCLSIMPYKRNHVCFDQKFCTNCDKVVEIDHKCF